MNSLRILALTTSSFVAPMLSVTAIAQAPPQNQAQKIDHYTAAKLAGEAQVLSGKLDSTNSSSTKTLDVYPNHLTMLVVRSRDGQSELHEHTADVFIVLDGSATLWTGGHMTGPSPTASGEVRGAGLEGGNAISLAKGDIVHIPADVPHQVRLAPGKTVTYFVVKVTEGK